MTTLLVLSAILAALPLLTWRIVKSLGRRAERANGTALSLLMQSLDRELSYLPLQRVLSNADLVYLRRQNGFHPGLQRRFLRERRRTALTYLRQMHRDFDVFSGFCRQLAPHSGNPGFAVVVARRSLLFHMLYAILIVDCRFGSLSAARSSLLRLSGAIGELRHEGEHRWGLLKTPTSEPWASTVTTVGPALGS